LRTGLFDEQGGLVALFRDVRKQGDAESFSFLLPADVSEASITMRPIACGLKRQRNDRKSFRCRILNLFAANRISRFHPQMELWNSRDSKLSAGGPRPLARLRCALVGQLGKEGRALRCILPVLPPAPRGNRARFRTIRPSREWVSMSLLSSGQVRP
jgi:hypothetical protein